MATSPTVTIAGASDGSCVPLPHARKLMLASIAWSGPFFAKEHAISSTTCQICRTCTLDSLVTMGCLGLVWCHTKSFVGGFGTFVAELVAYGRAPALRHCPDDDSFASHYRPTAPLEFGQLRTAGRYCAVAKLRAGCLPKLFPQGRAWISRYMVMVNKCPP